MRFLIVVLALVGLSAVSNAGPINRPLDPTLAEGYPFELYTIPPRENQNLSNYATVAVNVFFDAFNYKYIILKYVNDIKVSGKVPRNAEETVDELLSNWKKIVEDAHSFNSKTVEQLESVVCHVNYTDEVRKVLDLNKDYYKNQRDSAWVKMRVRILAELHKKAKIGTYELFDDESGYHTILDGLDKFLIIARLIKQNGVDPSFINRQQRERLYSITAWFLTSTVPPQHEVDTEVNEMIKEHGNHLPLETLIDY